MRVLLVLLILVIQKQKVVYALLVGCFGAGSLLWGVWGTNGLENTDTSTEIGSSRVVITVTGGEEPELTNDDEKKSVKHNDIMEHAVAGGDVWLGLDVASIRSAPKESLGITYCSKTARITLKSLTGESFGRGWEYEIPQGDAITLILEGIQEGTLKHIGFADQGINPSAELFQMLAFEGKEVADVYLYRDDPLYGALRVDDIGGDAIIEKRYLEQGHRFVVVLGTDGVLYALDPYRGDGTTTPQRLKEYVEEVQGRTMYVGNTYDAFIDQSILTLYESSRMRNDRKTYAEEISPEYIEQEGSTISVQDHLSLVRERNERFDNLETVKKRSDDGVDYKEMERLLGL